MEGEEEVNLSEEEKEPQQLNKRQINLSLTRRMPTVSNNNTIVTLRNNEGKPCTTKQLTKSKTMLKRKRTSTK